MERNKQQSELIYKVGRLLNPLYEIANSPEQQNAHTRSRAWARFSIEVSQFEDSVRNFCQGEPGYYYRREYLRVKGAITDFKVGGDDAIDDVAAFPTLLESFDKYIREVILTIPVIPDGTILEPNTPFASYCLFKDLCQGVTQSLVVIDRYLEATLFYRYLRDVQSNVKVTLVTWPEAKYNPSIQWAEFIDVSRLYAAERGNQDYQLLVGENIHDRFLCLDDQIFALGGSIKHAGNRNSFTITKVPSTPENQQKIAQTMASATELYGPSQPIHP